jgi:hypothetical protein
MIKRHPAECSERSHQMKRPDKTPDRADGITFVLDPRVDKNILIYHQFIKSRLFEWLGLNA